MAPTEGRFAKVKVAVNEKDSTNDLSLLTRQYQPKASEHLYT